MRTIGLAIAIIWLSSSALVLASVLAHSISTRARRWIKAQLFGDDRPNLPVRRDILADLAVRSAPLASACENGLAGSYPDGDRQCAPADERYAPA